MSYAHPPELEKAGETSYWLEGADNKYSASRLLNGVETRKGRAVHTALARRESKQVRRLPRSPLTLHGCVRSSCSRRPSPSILRISPR